MIIILIIIIIIYIAGISVTNSLWYDVYKNYPSDSVEG